MVCRGKIVFNSLDPSAYYVDSASTKAAELGTRSFPYKSIKSVFVELYQTMIIKDLETVILLNENVEHPFYENIDASIINSFKSLTIRGFSYNLPVPGNAILYFRPED